MSEKAHVREKLENIAGVRRAWIEWDSQEGLLLKRLVVEVDFDTDPNSTAFSESGLQEILQTAKDALADTPMIISNISIVPKGVRSGGL